MLSYLIKHHTYVLESDQMATVARHVLGTRREMSMVTRGTGFREQRTRPTFLVPLIHVEIANLAPSHPIHPPHTRNLFLSVI